MELLKVDLLEEAIDKIAKYVKEPEIETAGLVQALGRVLALDAVSEAELPAFNRSRVDGFSVVASDTQGASESLPVFLDVVGEVEMGKPAPGEIKSGQAMYVPTGGMAPDGSDGVVMVEFAESFGARKIAVYEALSSGAHMLFKGEETKKGDVILKKGRKLKGSDLGLLASVGISEVPVYRPWRIYVISTGDELVSVDTEPAIGQIRDVNTYSIIGEALEFGFEIAGYEVVRDDREILEEKVRNAMEIADFVVLSGGSSKGEKDMTENILGSLASSGTLTHGIAIKPGKPTILAFDEVTDTGLIGLPGHTVGAWLLFRLIMGELWESATGEKPEKKEITVKARMGANLAAAPGKKTYQLVRLSEDTETAYPVLGHSALIRTISEADGYIILDVDDEGINKGEICEVHLI